MRKHYKLLLILIFAMSLISCGGVGARVEESESPIAKNDVSVLKGNKSTTINVLENDSDPDGDIDIKTIVIETAPKHGEAVANNSGEITYTPKKGYFGSDSFIYTVKDMDGLISAPAMVKITIEKISISASLIVDKPAPDFTDNDGNGGLSKGDLLTYTITATNKGSAQLTNVEISDPMTTPSNITCVSVAPEDNCVLVGTYTIKAQDVTAGKIDNTATANSDQTGAESDDETVLILTPSLSVEKPAPENSDGDGNGEFSEGDVLTYTITTTNSGGVTLTNVEIRDQLIRPERKVCALVAPRATCILKGEYTITASDVTAGEVKNTARADSDQTDQSSDSNTIVISKPPALTTLTLVKQQNIPDVNIDFTLIAIDPDGKKLEVTVSPANNSETLTIIKHGGYTLSENNTPQYTWVGLSCTNSTVDGTDVSGVTKDNPNLNLEQGDEVICTFTNQFQVRPFKIKVRIHNYYKEHNFGGSGVIFADHTSPYFDEEDGAIGGPQGTPIITNGFHFEIPTNAVYSYDYSVDCNSDGTIEEPHATGDYLCTYDDIYTTAMKEHPKDAKNDYHDYTISISGDFPHLNFGAYAFLKRAYHMDNSKLISIEQWGTGEWQSMRGAFFGTYSLKEYGAMDMPSLTNVTDMSYMFYNSAFDQDIGDWDVSNVTDMRRMFVGSLNKPFPLPPGPLSTDNYDGLLKGWSKLDLQTGVIFDAGRSKSSPDALSAKENMINNKGWIIYDADNPRFPQ